MCFGSAPQAPQIVYQGPSAEDIERNRMALEQYRQQSTAQQEAFAQQLQQQIDRANAQMEEQRNRLAQEEQAAMADMAARQTATYAVTATQSEPVAAQTTTTVKPKEKRRSGLKITPGATAASSGSGLNIGV